VDADPVELRVLGCLIEKQRTTPDAYPLSLNALRLACNQSTNRDPVVEYDEQTIRRALDTLTRRGWARLASGPGSRAVKFRHLFDEAVGLDDAEMAVLAVLMLRGPQTPGELKQRTERLHRFAGLEDVGGVLSGLAGRELVTQLERRPGQKEQRYAHLLGAGGSAPAPAGTPPMGYLRVYADAGGESHFEDVELPSTRVADPSRGLVAELAEAIAAGEVVFRNVIEEPTDDSYPHVAPRRQFIVQLNGAVEIKVSDGETRRFDPGSVVLLEDTSGKGHTTRGLSPGGRMTLVITLPD
jgi:uncharacterized protein YceH (UPF0502 family)